MDRVKIITSIPNAEVTFEDAVSSPSLQDFSKTLKALERREVDSDLFELHKPKGISLCQDSMVITHRNMNVTAANKLKQDDAAKTNALKRKVSTISGFKPFDTLTPMQKNTRLSDGRKSMLSEDDDDLELEADDIVPAPSSSTFRGDSKDLARLALLSAPIDYRTPKDPRPLFNSQLQVKSVYRPKNTREEFRNSFSSPIEKYHDFEKLPSSANDGFANLGNTCYVNAILQALINLPTFKESLIFNVPILPEYQKSLHFLFASVVRRKDSQKIVSPGDLIDFIRKASSKFETDTQQDADEFLRIILDKLQDEYGALKENRDGNADNSEADCPVGDTFEFEIERELTCVQCGHTLKNVAKYRDLPLFFQKDTLALSKSMDIRSLLSFFFKPSKVSYACEKCPGKSANVEQRILSLPRILMIQLKRFDVDQRTMRSFKRSDEVILNQSISLENYLTLKTRAPEPVLKVIDLTEEGDESDADENQDLPKPAVYRLQAVVSHIGRSPVAGHYICDAYDNDKGEWKTYNDSQMTICGSHRELQVLRKETGYLLFYEFQQ